jgi:hypothetical protein
MATLINQQKINNRDAGRRYAVLTPLFCFIILLITINHSAHASGNIAGLTLVSASTQDVSTGQLAVNAVDGIIDGYPGDYTREWVTTGEKAGAWLQLNWSSTYVVDQIVLYDRKLLNNQITGATLSFSDGSSVVVGALDNAGGPTVVNFSPRGITWVRVTVTAVSATTTNVGLMEVEVFGSPTPTVNEPPSADAGADQVVIQGADVQLNGSGTDPNGDTLSYQWTQTAGTPVTLSSDLVAKPTFTAPAGLAADEVLTFKLVTRDGEVSSVPDTVNIKVQAEVAAQTGSLALQWTAPVTRTDGTPLSLADIDGYRIYYGESAGNYPNRLEVADGTAQSATITEIPVGTYYIVMTTYDVSGLESAYSSMVVKTTP